MLRTLHHREYPLDRLVHERTESISVCLPARNEAATIGPIVAALMPLVDAGAIDQVLVLDDSTDGTGDIARALGAEVHDQSALRSGVGPVHGKGDAMWRGLEVATGEIVVYLDADSGEFGPHFALGLAGAVACAPHAAFAKGFYRRPWQADGVVLPEGGGRVTELCARPALRTFFPDLAEFLQPLAGEIAVCRDLLERLPFVCGYGVDIALLIDAYREVGLDRMAQVDLECRQNAHQPLSALGPMAHAVFGAVSSRLIRQGTVSEEAVPGYAPVLERPPVQPRQGTGRFTSGVRP